MAKKTNKSRAQGTGSGRKPADPKGQVAASTRTGPPVATKGIKTAKNGGENGAAAKNLKCTEFSLSARQLWSDPNTGQTITHFRIDVLGDDQKPYYSDSDDVVVQLMKKIVGAHGGVGWSFQQSNGEILLDDVS